MISERYNEKDSIVYKYENHRPIIEDNTICFGYKQSNILSLCLDFPFPGSSTYSADHPIWTGYSGKCKTPIEAWTDIKLLKKAIRNWFYMICFNDYMITFNPDNRSPEKLNSLYVRYNDNWGKALKNWDELEICRYVLNRFTVAKIAPRVTALSANNVLKILEDNNIDISTGVYIPMAGFGGINAGAKLWSKKHNIDINIENYDINENFCNYFGWTVRDITAQYITTEKTVICCPPYTKNDECWEGTPSINAAGLDTYCGFFEWCKLICKYIKAPQYVLIGPNTYSKNSTGLFSKKSNGSSYYPEFLHGYVEGVKKHE